MPRRLLAAATLAASSALAACTMAPPAPPATVLFFTARMDSATEVPPHPPGGQGNFLANYTPSTHLLSYSMAYSGLTGPATAAHLHGPAGPGQNAPVVVPFTPPIVTPMVGSATINDLQAQMLVAGQLYANVHTAANPGGEIRGQVIPVH